jgi:phosphate transport system substrate-binding protein
VKALALANDATGPFVEPTKENMANRTYPLVESIYIYINRPPGQPVEPRLKAFLTYILSREGQENVQQDGGYLPLTPEVAREQLKKLE